MYVPLLPLIEVFSLKPILIPHVSYQDFIIDQLQKHFSGGILVLVKDDWPLIAKLWMTDLSSITTMLYELYGTKGPEPRDPASMLRCFLVGLLTHPTEGITEWVNILHRTPFYAILSGFQPGNVPGIGTFYDFFKRLWAADHKNVTSRLKSARSKKRKPKKGKKGEKAPTATPGRVKRLVEWILPRIHQKKELPSDRLFDFFQSQILTVSAQLGLLGDTSKLNAAGDGTPIVTSARTRSKSTCSCRAQGLADCNHPRVYSQPDCDIGWDSSRERYFNGYHMYMFNACDSPHDLPLYPRLQTASCHDSVSFVISSVEFSQRFTLGTFDKILLDSAHDAEAIYTLIDHQKQQPIIDLNKRGQKNIETGGAIQLSPQGVPICPKGKKMKPNGYDHTQNRQKWRCLPTCGCSTAKFGRTYHTHSKDNLRLFPKIARETELWKNIYKRRTSVERSNKREKIDYHLEDGRHRSTMMWMVRIYGIMMCQHMDAWFLHRKNELQSLQELIFSAAA
jgi:hypothetical protein